jgi:3-phosphoshikimate 1-carboxyvinyltransferase
MNKPHTNPIPFISRQGKALTGTAQVPGDKSISHRSLMFAALATGTSKIYGLLEGEDVFSTAAALTAMGAKIEKDPDGVYACTGAGLGHLKEPDQVLDMGNSGTSTRLLLGIVAGHPLSACFVGDASLQKRPMARVSIPLEKMGAKFITRQGGRLPLMIQGSDQLTAISYELPVASAQIKSAIMLAGLRAKGTTQIIEKEPTRNHSENMLRHFGVDVGIQENEHGHDVISISSGQSLQAADVHVPADPSSAAFLAVAASLQEGSSLLIRNVNKNPRRTGLFECLKKMGGSVSWIHTRLEAGESVGDIEVKSAPLSGIDVPVELVPSMIDEFPILAIAAACAKGTTHMKGLAELRVKESDRLLMIYKGLIQCGVEAEMGEDWLTIYGSGKPPNGNATIATALDHRIVMSFLILGSVTKNPVIIDDISPIATSFPNFVTLMNGLGLNLNEA